MSLENRYIHVESFFESELVQTLLFEAGASWTLSGKSAIPVSDSHIVINDRLEMQVRNVVPGGYKELSLLELVNIVQRDASVENDNMLHVCEVTDNHISFKDSEVDMTPDELSEVLRVIESLSHRDFEITTSDGDERVFPLANLTIHFK